MIFTAGAVADEATDARIAELEARIKSLEQQIQRLTALLEVAAPDREIAAADQRTAAAPGQERAARAQIEAPPLIVVTPQEAIRNEIRFECMQRQTREHAIGGAAPNYSSC
jgi:hypothetical protein